MTSKPKSTSKTKTFENGAELREVDRWIADVTPHLHFGSMTKRIKIQVTVYEPSTPTKP